MQSKFQKLSKAVLISSFVAIATPTVAAGLVAGTAGAVRVVADAGSLPTHVAATPTDIAAPSSEMAANNGPRRLSVLAGSDEEAWASARDVHVRPLSRQH